MSKKADSFMRCNTLACVVQMSLGKVTTVELRNESYATGKVTEVDGFMNVTLEDAIFQDPSGKVKQRFDFFFAPNRLIRCVQIPPEIDIQKELQSMFSDKPKKEAGTKFAIGGSRKKILAIREKRRQEDLVNALAMKKQMEQNKK